jgi:Helix-hairpin-helix domain
VPAYYVTTGEGHRRVEIVSPQWISESVAIGARQAFDNYRMLEAPRNLETSTKIVSAIKAQDLTFSSPNSSDFQPEYPRPSSPVYDPSTSLSCRKLTPLISPNEDLAKQLKIISESRRLEGNERSALSYSIAIAAIKAVPHKLKLGEGRTLAGVGGKIGAMVDEYSETGRVALAGMRSLYFD